MAEFALADDDFGRQSGNSMTTGQRAKPVGSLLITWFRPEATFSPL